MIRTVEVVVPSTNTLTRIYTHTRFYTQTHRYTHASTADKLTYMGEHKLNKKKHTNTNIYGQAQTQRHMGGRG